MHARIINTQGDDGTNKVSGVSDMIKSRKIIMSREQRMQSDEDEDETRAETRNNLNVCHKSSAETRDERKR